jgi:hypothetical protein
MVELMSDPGITNSSDGLAINEGKVQCPVCGKDIKVRMGGLQNFWKQHNPRVSKACKSNLERKKKAAVHQQHQPGLLSFFTKQLRDLVPPTVPTPTCMIAPAMDPASSEPHTTHIVSKIASSKRDARPDAHTVNLLMTLERAMSNLPALPEANETNEIIVFAQHVPTDLAKDNAWEYLDPLLNRFLGFNRTTESISEDLQGGERGLAAMVRYIREFAGRYQINGGLLEGKLQ